jgi:hypothetical protein
MKLPQWGNFPPQGHEGYARVAQTQKSAGVAA